MNTQKNKKKEKLLLGINSLAFLGGLFCFLIDFPTIGILFLLSASLMLPIFLMQSSSLESEAVLDENNTISLKLQRLEADYNACVEELKDCQRKSSYFQQHSFLPFFAEPEGSPYDLIFSIHFMLEAFSNRLGTKDFTHEIACEGDTFPITVNSRCMDLILGNVLDNAIKYVSFGGKINITLSRVDEHILIIIKDNGLGCKVDDTTKLFDLNVQEKNGISGNGLGLAQAKSAVSACGGQIWCKTSENKGFAVYLQFLEREEDK